MRRSCSAFCNMGYSTTLLLSALLLFTTSALADDSASVEEEFDIKFEPDDLLLVFEDLDFRVKFSADHPDAASIVVTSTDKSVSDVEWDPPSSWQRNGTTLSGGFNVTTTRMGYATLNVTLLGKDGEILTWRTYETSVLLSSTNLSSIFSTSLGVLVGCMYVVMGATIDLKVVKRIIKRPIGPILGLFCQYIVMPLFAFGLSQLVFSDPYLQLGMFMAGCTPGGGPSNVWTHLLGGTLDLSITMTFTSTFFALAAIPAWVLLLGPVISEGSAFIIPYDRIAISLVILIVPCSFGVATQRFLPKVAGFLQKILTPLSIFNVLYISTFGIYANRYIFEVIDVTIFFTALCLPFLGYSAGLGLALLLRQSRQDAIAISLETGIQNATVAMFLLNLTLPKPASHIAVVIPGLTAIITPLPLLCLYTTKTLIQKIRNRGKEPESEKTPQKGVIDTVSEKVSEKTADKPALQGVDNPVAADIEANEMS